MDVVMGKALSQWGAWVLSPHLYKFPTKSSPTIAALSESPSNVPGISTSKLHAQRSPSMRQGDETFRFMKEYSEEVRRVRWLRSGPRAAKQNPRGVNSKLQ